MQHGYGLWQSALLFLLVVPTLAPAQGICIPETITVKQVKGQVFFGYEGQRRTQEGVTVEVISYKGNHAVATTTTDSEGRFSFDGIKVGRYLLRTKHPQIIGLDVRLNIASTRSNSKAEDRLIVFVLGADPSKPCGGGHVEFIESSTKHPR
jgi:hypothetical protein